VKVGEPTGGFGSRVCENSDVVLESRISVSISEMGKPAALANIGLEATTEKTILNRFRAGTFFTQVRRETGKE